MSTKTPVAPVIVVKGEDPTLRDTELVRVVDGLFTAAEAGYGPIERGFASEDLSMARPKRDTAASGAAATDSDDPDSVETPVFRALLTALDSPPFVTPVRVVVVRDYGGFTAEQAEVVAAWVADPLPGVHLVLVSGGGKVPTVLDKALKAAGAPVVAPEASKTAEVLTQYLHEAGIGLDAEAKRAVAERFGEDAGRVPEFVGLLTSSFGPGARLRLDDVEPYLGERGRVAPYLLTNAIDSGDTTTALDLLDRMLHASSAVGAAMHGLQVMKMLVRHYESLLRIDSPDVRGENDAAAVLGIKPYPAKLRLQAARALGNRGIATAFAHLAQADLDLRGGANGSRALDPDVVMELLVVRLCALAARSGRGAARSGGGGRRR